MVLQEYLIIFQLRYESIYLFSKYRWEYWLISKIKWKIVNYSKYKERKNAFYFLQQFGTNNWLTKCKNGFKLSYSLMKDWYFLKLAKYYHHVYTIYTYPKKKYILFKCTFFFFFKWAMYVSLLFDKLTYIVTCFELLFSVARFFFFCRFCKMPSTFCFFKLIRTCFWIILVFVFLLNNIYILFFLFLFLKPAFFFFFLIH